MSTYPDYEKPAVQATDSANNGMFAELTERLRLAETVCTIYGWCGASNGGEREQAALQAWMDWVEVAGTPPPTPEWDARIAELAARRRGDPGADVCEDPR